MSKRLAYLITMDAGALLDLTILRPLTNEQVGAAVTIFGWMARGHDGEDDTYRRVAKYSRRRWSRDREGILWAVGHLIASSEHRVRFGRPTVSAARRAAILERDGEVCRYCRTTDGPFHIDHIEPVSRGGSNRDENLCVACAPCNLRKSAKSAGEWFY